MVTPGRPAVADLADGSAARAKKPRPVQLNPQDQHRLEGTPAVFPCGAKCHRCVSLPVCRFPSFPMSRSADRKTLRELLAGGGRHIGAAIAGLLTFPIVARVLNEEALGAWALLGAASFMLTLSDLGLTNAVQRAAVATDHGLTRRTIALALTVNLLVLVPFAIVAYFLLIDVPDAGAALRVDVGRAAAVVLVAGAVGSIVNPYRGFVYARGGVRLVANARTLGSLIQIAVLIVGFLLARTLVVPACALLANNLMDAFITIRAARRYDPELPLLPRRVEKRQEALGAFRDGAAQLSINMAVVMALRVDLFVLASVAPLAIVAAYGVAGRAVDLSYLIAKQATAALMPSLGNPQERARAVRIGTAVFGGVIMSGMMTLAMTGQPLLILWVGDVAGGHDPAVVLWLLAIAAMIMSTYEVISVMVMLGARTGWSCAVPIIIGSSVNLVISISLAPYYGIWAVGGSTIVGNTITCMLLWWRAKRMLTWNLGRVLLRLLPSLSAGAVSLAAGWALRGFAHGGPGQSLAACVVVMAAGLATAAALMRFTGRPNAGDSTA